jgi:hypothetical protein
MKIILVEWATIPIKDTDCPVQKMCNEQLLWSVPTSLFFWKRFFAFDSFLASSRIDLLWHLFAMVAEDDGYNYRNSEIFS